MTGTLDELPFDWGIVHMLTDEPMSLDEAVQESKKYNEQFNYEAPFDEDPARVALALIRLCEVGMAKVI